MSLIFISATPHTNILHFTFGNDDDVINKVHSADGRCLVKKVKVSASAVFWAEESFKSKSGSLGLTNKCIQYSKGGDRNLVGSDGRRKSC